MFISTVEGFKRFGLFELWIHAKAECYSQRIDSAYKIVTVYYVPESTFLDLIKLLQSLDFQ